MPDMNPILTSVRTDYTKGILNEESALDNPFHQFEKWLSEAFDSGNEYANAMVLSTANRNGMPDSRVVLLRNVSYGGFTFFTNYKSKKASDLQHNKQACLLFFWSDLQRQVRIEGTIEKLPEHESDEYFSQRPFESQVGAWVSSQSQVVDGREVLEKSFNEQLKNYTNKNVPRPPYWGGYVLLPSQFEFWQGRSSRLHDRLRYRSSQKNNWIIERLMP